MYDILLPLQHQQTRCFSVVIPSSQHCSSKTVVYHCYLNTGADPGGEIAPIAPPKTYESNFFHHNVVQLRKQHSRYKAIFSSNCFVTQVL